MTETPQGNPPMMNTVLVAGASGVIGAAAVASFAALPGWQVLALSRRRPVVGPDCTFTHVPVDLTDNEACRQLIASLPGAVTHLVYAAVAETPGLVTGWCDRALMETNAAMFANLLGPLAEAGGLRHVSLLQGTKAYGAHVHPVEVPLREDDPRDDHPNFYWLQEDRLRETGAKAGFDFTIWRPQVLLGSAPGAAMNPVAAIGAYAALCHARGLPFAMPGTGEALWELVDTDLLAAAMAWAAKSPKARGQIFNITNGDVFVLRHAWPKLALDLGLATAGPAPGSFVEFFAQPESQLAWARIARDHELLEPSLDRLLGQSHVYVDLLNSARIAGKSDPALLSTIKLRQAGFAGCRDSFASLTGQLRTMADLRLLPPVPRN